VENCQQFDGFRVAYRLESPDRNASAAVQACHTAVAVTQAADQMWGLLYVNDSEALSRPECQDLRYLLVAQEERMQLEASAPLHIRLEGGGEASRAA